MKTKKELEITKKGLMICFIFGWITFGFGTFVSIYNFFIESIPILLFVATTLLILLILLIDTRNRLRKFQGE